MPDRRLGIRANGTRGLLPMHPPTNRRRMPIPAPRRIGSLSTGGIRCCRSTPERPSHRHTTVSPAGGSPAIALHLTMRQPGRTSRMRISGCRRCHGPLSSRRIASPWISGHPRLWHVQGSCPSRSARIRKIRMGGRGGPSPTTPCILGIHSQGETRNDRGYADDGGANRAIPALSGIVRPRCRC